MKIIKLGERVIVIVLLGLMMMALILSTVELAVKVFSVILTPPFLLIDVGRLMDIFEFFLVVMIGLELLETIKIYFYENRFHLEIVMVVALIAAARKIIVLDYEALSAHHEIAIAAIILSLSLGYYLIRRCDCRRSTDASSKGNIET